MPGYRVEISLSDKTARELAALAEGGERLPQDVAREAVELFVSLPHDVRLILSRLTKKREGCDGFLAPKDAVGLLRHAEGWLQAKELNEIAHELLP
jgi:hypothetical protein